MRLASQILGLVLLLSFSASCTLLQSPAALSTDPCDTNQNEFVRVEIQPAFLHKETPVYPRLAERASMEGTVWVKIHVNASGMPDCAVIAKESGANAGFEEAAIEAAYKCVFSPAIQDGKPIAIWITFPFEFKLER